MSGGDSWACKTLTKWKAASLLKYSVRYSRMSVKGAKKGSTFLLSHQRFQRTQADWYFFLCWGVRCWKEYLSNVSRNSHCLILSPQMGNMARCSLGNIGCIPWGSAGSFKRCLVVGMRTEWSTRRPPWLCFPDGGDLYDVWFALSYFVQYTWYKIEGEEGITLEGCPVHCQSIRVQCTRSQMPVCILKEMGENKTDRICALPYRERLSEGWFSIHCCHSTPSIPCL